MSKKIKKHKQQGIQLSIFDTPDDSQSKNIDNAEANLLSDENFDNSEDDWWLSDEDFDSNFEPYDRTIEPETPELLTLKLLQESIGKEDSIMADFAEYVLPNLLRVAIGVTAKGGKFFDRIDRRREAEGKAKVRRDNAGDQSLNTHLLNGLFPANAIEQRLEKLDTTVRRVVKEKERRMAIAGFILHDFEKFDYNLFLKIPEKYRKIRADINQKIRDLSLEEHREIIDIMCRELGLDVFLCPEDTTNYKEYIDDMLCVAYNAQEREGTNWNFSEFGLNTILRDRVLVQLSLLSRLADLLSSIIKHPQDAINQKLKNVLHNLSDGQLKFTYHSLAENRGVLTNVVNNALIEAHTSLNTEDKIYYEPLLYLPTGVIYLARRDAPSISKEELPKRVIHSIKKLCADRLMKSQTGFGRDGKGMKYADYYEQFFDDIGLMEVGLKATLRILRDGKKSVAKDRSNNLVKFQQKGVLSADYDFNFEEDIRCDRIAEFGDVMSRKIWGEKVKKIEAVIKQQKKDKKQPQLPPVDLYPEDLVIKVAEYWQLSEYLPQIREIQRINESLKENKLKGNTGGVPYEWYYLAAKYLQKNPGMEDEELLNTCEKLIEYVGEQIKPIVDRYQLADGWDDLRLWVDRTVMLPETTTTASVDVFLDELKGYQLAKKSGRGKQLICSVSHSPYSVTEQMESAVLFTPQVYTNKQMLGGSNAKRNISSIAGVEMMLRQILMNQTQAVGKRFEDGKYRYLYFYPTYYFTPETNKFLQKAYVNIAQTRFSTGIRDRFISKELKANFSKENYQSVDAFLIDEDLQQKKNLPEDNPEHKKDRTFKLSYPENLPLTFYFMALPPGKDPTDTESWIMPSWLGFAFPIILDVKTVVSESPIPPFNDGAEFEETVFLDSAPQAFRLLLKRDRFRLDYILEGWEEKDKYYSAPLNVLTAAYAIHFDVNAKQGKGGYDPNWGKLTELATDFETSPLYVFSYLKKYARKQKGEIAGIKKIKLYAYDFYPCFDAYAKYEKEEWKLQQESPLNHPKNLTELYRKFYRANKKYNPKANAVLKPIDVAAKALLECDINPEHPLKLTELYRQFYRADKKYNPKANSVLKPIDIATETILKADRSYQGNVLTNVVAAEVAKLIDRVHSSTAEGFPVIKKERERERQLILDFASYFVEEVFEGYFKGDRARLAGRQINLIRDTCEFLYRLENDKENSVNTEQKLNENTLIYVVAAEVAKLMDRVHSSTAEGFYKIQKREEERPVILDFARYFVIDVFEETFRGDRARLAGRQINLIRDTCEFLYRLENDKENQNQVESSK